MAATPIRADAAPMVYQFKITLHDSRPLIWRRIQVRADTSLWALNHIVQVVMGWGNAHLHRFLVHGKEYGDPYEDPDGYDPTISSEVHATLSKLASPQGLEFKYLYDFGDNWLHTIRVEKIIEEDPGITYPRCLTGARACPPDDCGGIPGYEDFLHALSDPKHPDHERLRIWIGGEFDPEAFSVEEVNDHLHRLSTVLAKAPTTP